MLCTLEVQQPEELVPTLSNVTCTYRTGRPITYITNTCAVKLVNAQAHLLKNKPPPAPSILNMEGIYNMIKGV